MRRWPPAESGNRGMHEYKKVLFPGFREARFVRLHRYRGHKLVHLGPVKGRCSWKCNCGDRYKC